MQLAYNPRGTCSTKIEIAVVEDGKIEHVEFSGGCPGNLVAISKLVKGMDAKEAVEKLEGIRCGVKKTSCADQLAQALKQALS